MSGRIKTKEEEEEEREEGNEREERKTKLQHNFSKTRCTNQTFMHWSFQLYFPLLPLLS